MPQADIIYFKEAKGSAPVIEWLKALPKNGRAKCIDRIFRLAEQGLNLRRPLADSVRGTGLYELRAHWNTIQYRILYFFYGLSAVILVHSFQKKGNRLPPIEIDRALARKKCSKPIRINIPFIRKPANYER